MELFSLRTRNLAPSATMAMAQKSADLKAQGVDVIGLTLGEPDFNTPPHVKEAAKKAIDDNFSGYSPVMGYNDLLDAIIAKFKNENQLEYRRENLLVSNGAKHSIANILLAIVDRGDEVIVPAPYWVSYPDLVKFAEGTPVIVEAGIEADFKITPAQLEAAITPATKAVFINSPSNPTGCVYTKEELKALADVLAKYPQVYILSDEIYEHILFDGEHQSIAQFENVRERVIVINGVSKGFAMTGWRIGYIAGPVDIIKACRKIQGQTTSGASSIAQKASVAALTGDMQYTRDMCAAFDRRRKMVLDLIADIDGIDVNVPTGAFYVFPDISGLFGKKDGDKVLETSDDVSMFLLEKGHVGTVMGSAFGSPNCIRISYAAADDVLIEAFKRIKDAVATLQ